MNINSLPDLVLCKIFSRVPLLDQLNLHHVCPFWKSLQSSVTCTRKCLTLFVGEKTDPPARSLIDESPLKIPHLDQIESDSARKPPQESTLEFSKLHDDLTTHLVSLFPNISSLCLVLNETDYKTVDHVIQLLEKLFKSLKSLSFYGHFNDDDGIFNEKQSKQFLKLISFIDQHCLLLEYLILEFHAALYESEENPGYLDLSCLALLKEFQFFSYDNAKILFKSLKQYANDRLERISIGNQCVYGGALAEFVQHPKIAAKFVALPLFTTPKQRQLFITFNSLTTLWFDLIDLSLPEFTAYLAPLHNLLYLHLTIDYSHPTIDYKELSQYDATPSYEFCRLPSLKILVLRLTTQSHTNFHSRHWSTILPSLQFVEMFHFGGPCEQCPVRQNYEGLPDGSVEQDKRNQCLKMLLGTLKQCDQLKKIVTIDYFVGDGARKEWTIEDLN